MNDIQKEIKRQGKLTRSHLQTYEQFIEEYKQYKALRASTNEAKANV